MKPLTADEFRKLSDEKAGFHWLYGHYPFDRASCCGACLTTHAAQRLNCRITASVRALWFSNPQSSIGNWLKAHYEELLALRIFYSDHYPGNPVQEEEELEEIACT